MITAKVKDASKAILQADNSEYLDVEFDLLDDAGEVLATKKLGFALDASAESIEAELAKYAQTYQNDMELAEKNKEREEAHAKADETIAQLKGQEKPSEAGEAEPAGDAE